MYLKYKSLVIFITVPFDQYNASLFNKSINFLKKLY